MNLEIIEYFVTELDEDNWMIRINKDIKIVVPKDKVNEVLRNPISYILNGLPKN